MKNCALLFILSISLCIYLSSADGCEESSSYGHEPEHVTCDPDNRPEVCPFIYDPVCATLADCRYGGSCTKTYGNACSACSDPNVVSYVPGECPNQPIGSTVCDPNNRPDICPLIYAPVCGTLEDCIGGLCTQTYGNDCSACADHDVESYVPGECPPTECDPDNRPEVCNDIYAPVCARLEDCIGGSCTQTAGNACYACGDPNVIFYVPGECPPVQCDPNDRPEACTDIYAPVCATLADCHYGDSCTETAGNACYACADPNVLSYVPGECPV